MRLLFMNVLFVCKWNCFRSKAAEAIFNKINTHSSFHAKSAGIFSGTVTEDILIAGKHLNLDLSSRPKGLSHKLALWADTIIIVADDVPKELFGVFKRENGKKILQWNFKDIAGTHIFQREDLMKKIQIKVEKFLLKNQ